MRRRFGRGRRNTRAAGEGRRAPIDAPRALERIVAAGLVPVDALAPVSVEDIPDSYAVVGSGQTEANERIAVGFAPVEGGDAALATLAFAQRLAAEEDFRGDAVAVAPQWSIAARRRLGLVGPLPFRFRAVAASALAEDDGTVEPEPSADPPVVGADRVVAGLGSAGEHELLRRALTAFEGLAAKHGGAVRGYGAEVELVLLARRVAVLRGDGDGLVLEALLPDRFTTPLSAATLATSMDRLEGSLRKRLNDRRVRGGEEGLRAQVAPSVAAIADLRSARLWPLGGQDSERVDLIGIDADGGLAVGAVRSRLTLPELGSIVDAALSLRWAGAALLGPEAPAAGNGSPRLLLAATEIDPSVLRVLPALTVEHALYDVKPRRGHEPELIPHEAVIPVPPKRPERSERAERRFDEVSLFDLDDESGSAAEASGSEPGRRRRRGRGRRRGRRGGGAEAPAVAGPERGEAGPEKAEPTEAREEREPLVDDADDLAESLAPLEAEVPELEAELEESLEAGYEEEEATEEGESDEERLHREREARRRARIAKVEPEPAVEEAPRPRRRRAAFVAHADRESVAAAILLARDHRLIEGFWVFPQHELMTFFRSIATDLREETPIQLVGFRPAHDALQAAALYGDRLAWFDHHDWPPEDLERLRQSIGTDNVHVAAGAGSSLPMVVASQTRRSRFSDKLVELVTGRFSEHDFERWGRVWWHRLAQIAQRSGERRSDVDPLLIGRPSDLAREAAAVPPPPVPDEVSFVSQRDFRLVHFGGYTLVVVPVPPELDLHLAARVARERYGAELSLALVRDEAGGIAEELIVLGGEEGRVRRSLDLGRMVDHLVAKHDWIERLPDGDHVARLRVRDLGARPERLDELIREIAMGRSILEG
jgi:hypothetical protein